MASPASAADHSGGSGAARRCLGQPTSSRSSCHLDDAASAPNTECRPPSEDGTSSSHASGSASNFSAASNSIASNFSVDSNSASSPVVGIRVGAVSMASSSLPNAASSPTAGADQLKAESRPDSGRVPGHGSSSVPTPKYPGSAAPDGAIVDFRRDHAARDPSSRTSGISSSHHEFHPPLPAVSLAIGPVGACATVSGNSSPDSDEARSPGVVLNFSVAWFQEISPPLKPWVIVSPETVGSPVGAPRVPVAPPSSAQAALIAPRTTIAPVSGVQNITGLSGALKKLMRLLGSPPSDSVPTG